MTSRIIKNTEFSQFLYIISGAVLLLLIIQPQLFLQLFRDLISAVLHRDLISFLRTVLGIPHLRVERILPCDLRIRP